MEDNPGTIEIDDSWIEKYRLDFGKTPGIRLNLEEWHSVLVALSMRFSFSEKTYRQLPKSVQEKFTEIK